MHLNKRVLISLIPFIVFTGIAVIFWFGLRQDPALMPSALLNKPLPTFEYPSLDNEDIKLNNKEFIGKISLLNVWATWCPNCLLEHEMMTKIANSNLVKVYGLNYKDSQQDAKAWLMQHGNPYTNIIFDPEGKLGIDLGVYGAPETFLIDAKGIIRHKYVGPMTMEVWQQEFVPVIASEAQDAHKP